MTVASRLLSLGTLSLVAVLICSFQATPATALSIEVAHSARSMHSRAHDALAKRKRSDKKSKRCKPRPAPSSDAHSSSKPAPTSSKASPAPAPSKSSSNNNQDGDFWHPRHKCCAAWPNGDDHLDQWKGVSFLYTWSPAIPKAAKDLGIPSCPMLWGWNQVQQFQDEVNKNPPKCAMGMNEPEIPSQSNISPQDAAGLWNKYIRPLKAQHGTILFTPATTSDPAGKQWYKDFFNACGEDNGDKCGADIMATHWYDNTPEKLIDYLNDLHNTFGMPIAVTEFACQNFNGPAQCSQDQVWSFQSQVTAFMESASFVHSYCPFGAMRDMQGVNSLNQLMSSDGKPNSLWNAYFNA